MGVEVETIHWMKQQKCVYVVFFLFIFSRLEMLHFEFWNSKIDNINKILVMNADAYIIWNLSATQIYDGFHLK